MGSYSIGSLVDTQRPPCIMGSAGVSDASRLSPPPSHVNPSPRHDRRSGHEPPIPQRDTHHAAVPYPHPDPAQQLQSRKDRRNVTDQPTAHDVTQRPRTGEDDQARLELWRGGCSDNPLYVALGVIARVTGEAKPVLGAVGALV